MKTVLYMAMSVNGFIAKEDNETPWGDAVWKSYYKIAKQFQAIILGRKTYEIMKEVNEFNKIGNPFTIVLSSKTSKNDDKIAFVKSPQEALEILKEKGFEQVLVGGGGKLNSSFMKENLIDELYLDIEPLVFGKGIKIFEEGNFEAKLELLEVNKLSENVIHLHYKIKENSGINVVFSP